MPIPVYDVRSWIRTYQRRHGLQGVVNKNNLVFTYHDAEWSEVELVDDEHYSTPRRRGCRFSTTIGVDGEITTGKLKGFNPMLSLSLDGLPWFITKWLDHSIDIELGHRTFCDTGRYTFTKGEIKLARNRFATFECEVELEGSVIFNTSTKNGSIQSHDEVDITDIIRNPRWTVEGECTFHLGLNDSIERL